jgi:hypothetical protein
LFPVAQNSEQQSVRETRSTMIAESVMEALTLGQESHTLRVATGITNGIPIWKSLHGGTSTNISLFYDDSCEPLREATSSSFANSVNDPQVSAIVTLTLTPKPSAPGMIHAEVSVATPASAPADHRTIHRFTRLLVTP